MYVDDSILDVPKDYEEEVLKQFNSSHEKLNSRRKKKITTYSLMLRLLELEES